MPHPESGQLGRRPLAARILSMVARVPIRQAHSGLDGHDEIMMINGATAGSIHANDYQFLT
jgi:hypothetical protein